MIHPISPNRCGKKKTGKNIIVILGLCGAALAGCATYLTLPSPNGFAETTAAGLPAETGASKPTVAPSGSIPSPEAPLSSIPSPLAEDFHNVAPFPSSAAARLVTRAPDGSVQILELAQRVGPGFSWSAGGLGRSYGNAAGGYVYELRTDYLAVIGASGEAAIPFFPSPYMEGLDYVSAKPANLAVWPSDTPQTARLAWSVFGWDDTYSQFAQELFVVSPIGAGRTTLIVETEPGDFPLIRPLRWSRDGQKLYYDRVPDGLGGWIPFGGAAGLYEFDLQKGVSREWIQPDRMALLCIGDLSRDERRTADNCGETYELEIRDLQTGEKNAFSHPADFPAAGEIGFGKSIVAGGARFSPQAAKVVYGLALEPQAASSARSWLVAVDLAAQTARTILAGGPGELLFPVGWLNEEEILFRNDRSLEDGNWTSSLWIVRSDGTGLLQIAEGELIAVLEP